MDTIKVIGFDADDTLWINEPFFQNIEKRFVEILSGYADVEMVSKELFATEMENLPWYGYGVKGFTLSMIETALKVSANRISPNEISDIVDLGKSLLDMPIELLPEVEKVLKELNAIGQYKLLVATKGDLTDQQRKLRKSGLEHFFDHIEIMSHKTEEEYSRLLQHLGIAPADFLMIGNSLKADILPVLSLGGCGIHIPFGVTWQHEKVEQPIVHPNFYSVKSIGQVIEIVG